MRLRILLPLASLGACLPLGAVPPALEPGPPRERPAYRQDFRRIFPRTVATDAQERLFRALREEDAPEIERLVRLHREAPTWTLDEEGNTALHLAARQGSVRLVEYLLRKGADLSARNRAGLTALHAATLGGPFGVDRNGGTRFEWLPEPRVVRFLLDRGADPRAIGADGRTATHLAARCGSLETVALLAERGAPLETLDTHEIGRAHV